MAFHHMDEVGCLSYGQDDLVARLQRQVEVLGATLAEVRGREQALFDHHCDPLWIYDPATLRILQVNDVAIRQYGYTRDEFLAMTVLDIRPAEDVPALLELIARRDPTAPVRVNALRHIRKDGQVIDVEVNSHAISFHGRLARLVRALDITDRLKAERKLLASEMRLRLLVENMQDTISLHDATGRIVYITPSCSSLSGYDAAEWMADDLHSFPHPDDRDLIQQALTGVLAGRQLRFEWRCRSKQLGYHWVETIATPIGEGPVTQFVCCTRDIIDRKKGEEERHLLEDQLRQAQKLEAVGRLAGGVAHDFNNLLTIINGCTEMALARLAPGDERANLLGEVINAGRRASELTRQLLLFSRKQTVFPALIDLNQVVAGTSGMLGRLLGEDVDLHIELASEPPLVFSDRGLLDQVLMNLCINARDAMPRGGRLQLRTRTVHVEAGQAALHQVATGPFVVLEVSDTGVGMSAEVQRCIFEPFFTTKEPGKGTGLGLPTVYGIVHQSGGFITLQSAPGQGASFHIYLPRQSGAVVQPTRRSEHSAGGRETILVVEDEASVRSLTRQMLTGLGYRVLEAGCGADAVRLVEEARTPIDLLITDVVMPGMTGRELVEQLSETRAGLKVLYVSGYTSDELIQRDVREGTVALLEKPFTLRALARSVRGLLDREGEAEAAVAG